MLNLSQFLARVKATDPMMAQNLDLIQRAINQLGTATGTDPTGTIGQPQAPGSVQVKAAPTGESVHVTITDHAERSRQRNYFLEWSANDPNFTAPYVEHLGVGRNKILSLPTFMDDGMTTQKYYFQAYSMDPGSTKASDKVVFGTSGAPTAITLNGTTACTLLQSTGAGTARTDGGEPGQGYGNQVTAIRVVGNSKRSTLK